MRGSAAFRTAIAPGGVLAGPWVKNPLWRTARAVPSLDLPFADNKSLTDAVTGQSLVTFTRASSGTYVDSAGTLRTAVTNLATWSEDFRNTADAGATRLWTYNTSAVTADNTTAPNGTNTADLVAGAAGTANKFLSANISATVTGFYTFSIYLKQGTEQFVTVRLSDGSANGIRGRFNLSAGTVVITNEGTATGQAANATDVGGGWYRCVVTCSVSAVPSSVMQPQLWLNNFASTSLTTNYYAWGAQLEQSSTVGEYIPTTSTINSAPRFDHNPTTLESLGLLVEEARTNVCVQSEDFSTNQATNNVTIATNQIAAPDSNTTADLVTATLGGFSNTCWVQQASTIVASTASYTSSVFIKQGTSPSTTLNVAFSGGTYTEIFVRFDFATKTVSIGGGGAASATAGYQQYPNGWFRLWAVFPNNNTGTTITHRVYTRTEGATNVVGDSVYLWGRMTEAGASPTSYIPTTTAAATRSADVPSITGSAFSSWYQQNQGTVFVDCLRNYSGNFSGYPNICSFNDGTANNLFALYGVQGSQALTSFSVQSGGVAQTDYVQGISTAPGPNKISQALATNSSMFVVNGTLTTQDGSVTMPVGINRVNIGNDRSSAAQWGGTIRRLVYWGQRLPDNLLQAITQ